MRSGSGSLLIWGPKRALCPAWGPKKALPGLGSGAVGPLKEARGPEGALEHPHAVGTTVFPTGKRPQARTLAPSRSLLGPSRRRSGAGLGLVIPLPPTLLSFRATLCTEEATRRREAPIV